MAKQTDQKWHSITNDILEVVIKDEDSNVILKMPEGEEETAEKIVTAVNNFEEMKAALKTVKLFIDSLPPSDLKTQRQNKRAMLKMIQKVLRYLI